MSFLSRSLFVATVAAASLLSTGCLTHRYYVTDAKMAVLMTGVPEGTQYEVLGPVKAEQRFIWHYSRKYDISPAFNRLLEPAEPGGLPPQMPDAIINTNIRRREKFSDVILTICTLGFAWSRTVEIEGTAIRYRK